MLSGNIASLLNQYFANYQGLPRTAWRGIWLTLINSTALGLSFFLTLYFVGNLHFSVFTASLFMSCYGLGTVLGGVLAGKLCDYFQAQKVIFYSLAMQGIAFLMLTVSKDPNLIGVTMLLLGISTYSFKTANYKSMLEIAGLPESMQLRILNISNVASNFGLGISGIIVGMFSWHSYHFIFIIAGATILFSALYLMKYYRQEALEVRRSNIEYENQNLKPSNFLLFFSLASIFLVGIIVAQLGSTYPLYIETKFPVLGTQAVSILFLLDTILIVLLQAPLSSLYSRYNPVVIMGLGAFLMGAGMLILSLASIFVTAIISCVLWTFGEMLFFPTSQLICYANGGDKKKGQVIGLCQSIFALSAVIGPSLGGFLYVYANHNAMWYLSMGIGALCLFICVNISNTNTAS